MNSILITGRIISTRIVNTEFATLLNVIVVDDKFLNTVRFHTAFKNDDDIEKIQSVNAGDEITFSGTVRGFSAKYNNIEIYPEKIISLANVKREYVVTEDENEDPAVEDQVPLQHGKGLLDEKLLYKSNPLATWPKNKG